MNDFEKHIKKSEHPENYYNPKPLVYDGAFARPWQVLRPIVYRYMEEEWIDSFLKTGKIRLSTLKKCASAEDEARKDNTEIYASGYVYGRNFQRTASTFISPSNYLFCTSLICDKSIANEFQTGNYVLMIKDTIGFADLISRQIQGFHSGIEGACIYQEDSHIIRLDENDEISKLCEKLENNLDDKKLTEDIKKRQDQVHFGMDMYFIKELKYSKQMEYRMVWFIDSRTDKEYLDVQIPAELVNKICEKRKLDF